MKRNIILLPVVLLVLIFAQGMAEAKPIEVTQGEQVTLTLKLVNVGDMALSNVKAEFLSIPSWIRPESETALVSLPAKSQENFRPTALLPFSFTVSKDAPVGKSNPLNLKITSSSGDFWNKEILLSVMPRPRPKSFALFQNYPNPFNPEVWIPYQLKEASKVTIKIYAVSGRLVKTLSLGHKEADFYITKDSAAYWDGKNDEGFKVASGVYFYHLQAGRANAVRKMLIVK